MSNDLDIFKRNSKHVTKGSFDDCVAYLKDSGQICVPVCEDGYVTNTIFLVSKDKHIQRRWTDEKQNIHNSNSVEDFACNDFRKEADCEVSVDNILRDYYIADGGFGMVECQKGFEMSDATHIVSGPVWCSKAMITPEFTCKHQDT